MDDIFIVLIIFCSCIPLALLLLFLDSTSSKKNYILLEYIDYLEKQLCIKNSDKELLRRTFIIKRQKKFINSVTASEIKEYEKVLGGKK